MAAKMAATFEDVRGPSSSRGHHRLFTKGENFSKYCNIAKTQRGEGGFHQPPPPCTTVGI